MIAGIMQPYFFPYFGYFDLINRCDRWIVFDVVQYAPKSWMNRNRVLHPTQGWQYVTVPVERDTGMPIRDVRVIDMAGTQRRILGQLAHYRQGRAPHYSAVAALVERAFADSAGDRLLDLNIAAMLGVCRYLGIACDYVTWSETGTPLPTIRRPGQWALEISAAIGASDYINPEGGRGILDPADFRARGIGLHFKRHFSPLYECAPYEFVPDLSIIDVLMWNSPERLHTLLAERKARPDSIEAA